MPTVFCHLPIVNGWTIHQHWHKGWCQSFSIGFLPPHMLYRILIALIHFTTNEQVKSSTGEVSQNLNKQYRTHKIQITHSHYVCTEVSEFWLQGLRYYGELVGCCIHTQILWQLISGFIPTVWYTMFSTLNP